MKFQTVAVNLGDTRSTSLIWTTKAAYSALNTTYIGLEFLSLGITLNHKLAFSGILRLPINEECCPL